MNFLSNNYLANERHTDDDRCTAESSSKKKATNTQRVMWKLFVVSKLTQYKMEGFYVDSHGSLHHGELEHILCFKGMIFTAINLWSAYILPMVSSIA